MTFYKMTSCLAKRRYKWLELASTARAYFFNILYSTFADVEVMISFSLILKNENCALECAFTYFKLQFENYLSLKVMVML